MSAEADEASRSFVEMGVTTLGLAGGMVAFSLDLGGLGGPGALLPDKRADSTGATAFVDREPPFGPNWCASVCCAPTVSGRLGATLLNSPFVLRGWRAR